MKKLRRSKKNKQFAGIAAGMAEFFGVDVVIMRAIWALLLIPGGLPGLVPYLILWLVIPEEE